MRGAYLYSSAQASHFKLDQLCVCEDPEGKLFLATLPLSVPPAHPSPAPPVAALSHPSNTRRLRHHCHTSPDPPTVSEVEDLRGKRRLGNLGVSDDE